ncbi:MAG: aspartate kinase [Planctomycetota bacterium]
MSVENTPDSSSTPDEAVKVVKFGGSSLASASQITKARDIVAADPARRFIVPSAPGKRCAEDRKITDLLYLCHESAGQGVAFDEAFGIIETRFREIVADLGVSSLDIDALLGEVKNGIAENAQAGRGPDYAASRGEYLNGRILAEYLGVAFVDAAEVIFFTAAGRLDADRTYPALGAKLKELGRAVVPGFYGSTPDGHVKTFSRGGSDVTGAIVARAAEAEVYENWTDVSGLLMTDPRVVDSPEPIDTLTYRELRELSYMGATVLHPEAVFPVRQAGIPVNIRNTNEPDHPGTRIVGSDTNQPTRHPITGIAGRKDFTLIHLEKTLMNEVIGYGERVLGVLRRHGVSFEHMPSGIDTLSLVVADEELEGKLDTVIADIRKDIEPDAIEIDPDLALIATVGRSMKTKPGHAATLFGALAKAGVNIRMIDQGSSELNIIVGVNINDFDTALRAIYAAFVD